MAQLKCICGSLALCSLGTQAVELAIRTLQPCQAPLYHSLSHCHSYQPTYVIANILKETLAMQPFITSGVVAPHQPDMFAERRYQYEAQGLGQSKEVVYTNKGTQMEIRKGT